MAQPQPMGVGDTFVEQTFEVPSRSFGSPHEVKLRRAERGDAAGTVYLTCSCPGGRNAWANSKQGKGCWAMQQVRDTLGIPQPA